MKKHVSSYIYDLWSPLIKNYKQLSCLFLMSVMLMFTCCQTEELVVENQNNSNYSIKKINMEEFEKRFNAVTAFNKFKTKDNLANARLMVVNGFTIETDEIVYIEKGNYHSYTFPIIREEENVKVENLILNYEPDGTYKTFLIQYDLSEQEKNDIINKIPIDVSSKTEINEIEKAEEIADTTASRGRTCWQVTSSAEICCQGIHDSFQIAAGASCDCPNPPTFFTMTYVQVDCPDLTIGAATGGVTTSGGGGSGPVGPGPAMGSGGIGNPRDVPIITMPLIDISKRKECLKIAALMNTGNHRSDAVALALPEFLNDTENEHGFVYNENGEKVDMVPAPELKLPNFPIQSFNHIHNDAPEGTLSIFSDADIEAIALSLKSNNINAGTFVATLSTSKGTHYALTIYNVEKFKAYFYHILNPITDPNTDSAKFYYSFYNHRYLVKEYFDQESGKIKKNDANNTNVLILFLNFMNQADMGITLFEADPTFEKFTKVSRVPNGPVKREPCN